MNTQRSVWLSCSVMAGLVVLQFLIKTAGSGLPDRRPRPADCGTAGTVASQSLNRPVEGVDFVRLSSTEFVFQNPPHGASWLVTGIDPDGAIRLWDFFGDGDRCTVHRDVERIFIQAATDNVMSYPLEVPDPTEYVEMLKSDLAREKQAATRP